MHVELVLKKEIFGGRYSSPCSLVNYPETKEAENSRKLLQCSISLKYFALADNRPFTSESSSFPFTISEMNSHIQAIVMMAKCTYKLICIAASQLGVADALRSYAFTCAHPKRRIFVRTLWKHRDLELKLQLFAEYDFNKFPSSCRMRNVHNLHFKCLFPCRV